MCILTGILVGGLLAQCDQDRELESAPYKGPMTAVPLAECYHEDSVFTHTYYGYLDKLFVVEIPICGVYEEWPENVGSIGILATLDARNVVMTIADPSGNVYTGDYLCFHSRELERDEFGNALPNHGRLEAGIWTLTLTPSKFVRSAYLYLNINMRWSCP